MSWYYAQGQDSKGPITQEEFDALRFSGQINDQTMVWREGWAEWLPLGQAPLGTPSPTPAPATGDPQLSETPVLVDSYQGPVVDGVGAEEVPADPAEFSDGLPLEHEEAATHFVAGARWFYWIAALSAVNSTIAFFQGGVYFVIGLAFTIIIDEIGFALSEEMGAMAVYIAFGVNLVIAGLVALFGYLSLKGIRAVMVIGIVLYIIDGLIFLLAADLLSVAFHAYASFGLIRGFLALNKLKKADIKLV
ncbi:DUF4339 domain-containing protein [Cerasicoccus arenae]|uniref:GYF domain-containing protein n=1 Tax=Cerasicoccus arenae TaxID=424488 RepID=A0A8J3DAZ1_9BACT|nr:GYF domain-containing protein [Cerasicoccus arenae]MBK1856658.1 DUF4339 domain-containing protein [Cerasicoccus arenae]GHB98730.1 hypothetical protein GCM10007047_13400 [Cerasicoccus arenae]